MGNGDSPLIMLNEKTLKPKETVELLDEPGIALFSDGTNIWSIAPSKEVFVISF